MPKDLDPEWDERLLFPGKPAELTLSLTLTLTLTLALALTLTLTLTLSLPLTPTLTRHAGRAAGDDARHQGAR